MNFNANAGGRPSFGRKIKRVSDVNAMGYNPYEAPSSNNPPQNLYPTLDNDNTFQQQGYQPTNNSNQQQQDFVTTTPKMPMRQPQYNPNQPNPYNMNPMAPMTTTGFGMLNTPVVQDMALQYGQQLAGAGTAAIKTEVEKLVPVSKLKYYFAVDTKYVVSKLMLLLFPFTHKDWSVKYEGPVQPRYEINAPDLYIPIMGYITYVVVAGLMLGTQMRFSPEQFGIFASSALSWCIAEVTIYCCVLYLIQVETRLSTFDLVAYSGYKFIVIICSVLMSLLTGRIGYYCCLGYMNVALAFFLVRSLKVHLLAGGQQQVQVDYYNAQNQAVGHKRRIYFLLFVAGLQPLLSWWLSCHLLPKAVIEPAVSTVL